MSWCGLNYLYDKYKKDLEAVNRLKEEYGVGHIIYKTAFLLLKRDCNDRHPRCKELKEILRRKL